MGCILDCRTKKVSNEKRNGQATIQAVQPEFSRKVPGLGREKPVEEKKRLDSLVRTSESNIHTKAHTAVWMTQENTEYSSRKPFQKNGESANKFGVGP
jgi:hypothetical protein